MKLDKLLNNKFLISSCVCLVLLLSICYIGVSSLAKGTYSADNNCYMTENGEVCIADDESKEVYGEYIINFDELVLPEHSGNGSSDLKIDFNFTAGNSLKEYSEVRLGYHVIPNFSLSYFDAEAGVYVDVARRDIGDTSWTFENGYSEADLFLNVKERQILTGISYMRFKQLITPLNRCYYNKASNSFAWVNVGAGITAFYFNSESSCNNARALTLVDSTAHLEYASDSYPSNSKYYFGGDTKESRFYYYANNNDKVKISDLLSIAWFNPYKGYEFAGWNTKADGSGVKYTNDNTVTLTSNVTLYAQWKPEKYEVTFIANGGVGTMDSQEISYGSLERLSLNKFTKDGYIFKEWNTKPDGSGKSYTNQGQISLDSDILLYAIWDQTYAINKYKVDEANKIIIVNHGVTKKDLEDNITLGQGYSVKIGSKIVETKEMVYTNDLVKIYDASSSEVASYTVCVLGDVNGDGDITTMDYIAIYNHFDNSKLLSGIYAMAADIYQDNDITTMDYIIIYNALGGN